MAGSASGVYLLRLDGLRGGEDVRVVLPLKHAVQHLQLLLREQVSPHLLPEEISARQGVAVRHRRLLNALGEHERGRVSVAYMSC